MISYNESPVFINKSTQEAVLFNLKYFTYSVYFVHYDLDILYNIVRQLFSSLAPKIEYRITVHPVYKYKYIYKLYNTIYYNTSFRYPALVCARAEQYECE